MTIDAEPEREIVRRALPFLLPAVPAALLAGTMARGWAAGWSAAIGVAIVAANFVVHGLSLARAARISLQALFGVAMVGFAVRLGVILGIMFLLDRFPFFSPVAFGLAVVPATILLLMLEMASLSGRVGGPPVGSLRPVRESKVP